MPWFRPRDLLDQTFEVGIILKGVDGLLEVIGGLLLLVVSPATIDHGPSFHYADVAMSPPADYWRSTRAGCGSR